MRASVQPGREEKEGVRNTTVTAEEFARARSVMQDIHRTVEWNPWVQDRVGKVMNLGFDLEYRDNGRRVRRVCG